MRKSNARPRGLGLIAVPTMTSATATRVLGASVDKRPPGISRETTTPLSPAGARKTSHSLCHAPTCLSLSSPPLVHLSLLRHALSSTPLRSSTPELLMDIRPSPALLRSAQILPQLPSIPSEPLSYSLAASDPPSLLVASISRLAPLTKTPRANRRPSTASSAEDKPSILPPAPPMGDLTPSQYSSPPDSVASSKSWSPDRKEGRAVSYHNHTIREMNQKANAAVAGLRAQASRLASIGASLLEQARTLWPP